MNRSFITRFIISLGWLGVIIGFLYVPSLYHLFFEDESTLNVVAFAQLISPQARARFKEKTGITVRLTHAESDDEIMAKLKLNHSHGYDMVIAFDYTIDAMRKEGLLAKIDHAKLENMRDIDTRFLHKDFDPTNQYSVPFSWLIYGIGYDAAFFKPPLSRISWDLVFKNPLSEGYDYNICMLNEMREAFFIASLYLFKNKSEFSSLDLAAIEKLLVAQRAWVESYASDRLDYLLVAHSIPLAVTPSSYMKKVLNEGENFAFAIPNEGSIVGIENCAIPAASKKINKVHEFINFLLSEEIATLNSNEYGLYPVNVNVYDHLDKKLFARLCFPVSDAVLENSMFIRNNAISLQRLEDLWIAVKAN